MAERIERRDLSALTAPQLVAELAGAQAKDASALLGELIRRFEPLLRRIWFRLGGSADDYPDFRQDALLKLCRTLPQLKEPAAFAGFFRRLAINEAYDSLRRSSTRSAHFVPMDETAEHVVDETMPDIDSAILIRSHLELLSPREQEVLQLEFVDGLTPQEIGKRWNVSTGAVRMTKSRAIARLRELLR